MNYYVITEMQGGEEVEVFASENLKDAEHYLYINYRDDAEREHLLPCLYVELSSGERVTY